MIDDQLAQDEAPSSPVPPIGQYRHYVNGAVPLHIHEEHLRRVQEQVIQSLRPPPREIEPVPDRLDLEAALVDAKNAAAQAHAKLQRSIAALDKASQIAHSSQVELEGLEQQDTASSENLAQAIRDWIAAGASGPRPQSKAPSVGLMQRWHSLEQDHSAAVSAVAALNEEMNFASAELSAATDALHVAARQILSLDAHEIATEIKQLQADLEHKKADLVALSLSSPGNAIQPLPDSAKGYLIQLPISQRASGDATLLQKWRDKFTALTETEI